MYKKIIYINIFLFKREYLDDCGIRICSVYYLITGKNLDDKFYGKLLDKLIEKDNYLVEGNTRLFINSLVHRERFRLWQFILTFLTKLNKEDYLKLMQHAEIVLLTEAQPSIRITIEWIMIRIILSLYKTYDFDSMWKKFENVSLQKFKII